ncbi:MAG: hypothetical protein KDK39_13805 [Leptospiraceae bacterium]|nr:hypothetical protein [Leptospiraceae bacterium]
MEGKRIKKSVVVELFRQNQAMRELLDKWPARAIMMDYEKEWNAERQELLARLEKLDLELG